ncbi:glycosyltransferase [Empedobacter brevis]|uniref:glycosyltransferase n=1 Tax=Empedobacter brevis TaxID=247 RepID=UPI0028A69651|nr:glycosyltransferase [Empedobacter brevis]
MESKRILILFQPHRSYQGSLLQMLVEAIKIKGYEVEYVDITNKPVYQYHTITDRIRNIYQRRIHKNKEFILTLEAEFYNRYYYKKIKEFKSNHSTKFDYILVIKPEEFTEKIIKEIVALGEKSVGFIWDGLRLFLKENLKKSIRHLDNVYSFDTNNIKEHPELKLDFCTNFGVFNKEIIPYQERKFDLFYIGDLAGTLESQRRDKKLHRLLQNIGGHIDVNILFRENEKRIEKIQHSNIKYIETFIPMEEALEKTRNSKIVIDICKAHHIGLSFRFFECLATETKMITNNKDVINYDFYHSNNIMIVDFDNDILDEKTYNTFLAKPYEKIEQTILQKYSIENWIKYLFREDNYIQISKK